MSTLFPRLTALTGQEYEKYLPTSFDESLSMLQKVNKILKTLNEVIELSNNVADEVVLLRDEFNVLKEWLENEGLEEKVTFTLDEWFLNGKLAQIINDEVFDMKVDKVRMDEIGVNVKTFGAIGDGVTDDSQAILNALAVSKNIYFPDGEYLITFNPNVSGSFYTFTDTKNIRIKGKGATIKDVNTYTVDALPNVFKFVNCQNIEIDVNFDAFPISDPHTNLGYRGASALYFENKCSFIKVTSNINNFRYGIRSGNYTIASYGYCSNFDLRLKTYGTGYPVALYLSDNINVDIDAEESHRIGYFAGCDNLRGNISYKGFVLANQHVLLSNSLTSAESTIQINQRARGCTNVDLNIVDNGSTCDQSSRSIAGINLQWVCEGTKYENIKLNLQATTDDTSRTLGGFSIVSAAKTYRTEYLHNWEPYIYLRNITISGSIDRTKQTLPNSSWGDIYIAALDLDDTTKTHAPTVSNINFSNFTLIRGTITQSTNIIRIPILKDTLGFDKVIAEGANFSINVPLGKVKVNSSVMGIVNSTELIGELIQEDSTISSILATVTKQISRNAKNPLFGENGYSYSENGLITQWKKVYYNVTAGTDMVIPFPIPFPVETMNVQLTANGGSTIITTLNGITKDNVTIRCNTTNQTIYISALGR